ncbi:MAG: tetratricopeptide repeat protein [Myxococcota bacterium]
MQTASVCAKCGFENPKAWRACAACGSPLTGSVVRERAPEGATMVSAAPDFDEVQELSSEEIDVSSYDQQPVDEPGEDPLIGQRDAAAAIQTGVETAVRLRAPTLVALEGGRGSGKTRLLIHASELAARLDPNVRVLYSACREGGDGPYAPFSRLLLERFGVTPSSSPSAVRAQMSTTVRNALQTSEAVAVAETTHLLGHVAGVPFPDSPFLVPLKNNPDELHLRSVQSIQRLLEGEAKRRPLLLLLDNLHWAEDTGWDVVAKLCESDAPIAIVVAGDEPLGERAAKLEPRGGVAVGPVAPLTEEDVGAMLHVVLPNLRMAPEPLVAAVTHRSGGNPSAVRELAFALWEAGLFLQGSQGLEVDLARLEEGSLPVSMEDAIRARLERLSPIEHATLSRAAVVGEVFWDGAILGQMRSERKAPGGPDDPLSIWPDDDDALALTRALWSLEEKGFLLALDESDLPGAREYAFASGSARSILYDALPRESRVDRHGAVARWLGLVGTMRREGVAGMIAPHLEKAGQEVRAGRAYLEAAVYERVSLRTLRALQYIEKALAHIPDDDVVRRIEALHEHGSVLHTLGRYDEAMTAFAEMLQLAWNVGARGKGGAALNRLARAQRARGEDEKARALLKRALDLFRAAHDLRGVASTLDDLAQVDMLRGQVERAIKFANEALEIRRAHQDSRGEAVSLHTLAQLEMRRGNLETADQLIRLSLEIREQIGDQEGMLQSHNALGILAFERGDRTGAVFAWRAALERAKELADRRSECFLLNNVGEARIADGAYDEADVVLERALELARDRKDKRALADIERNLGILALRRGDDNASDQLDRALEAAQEYGGREALALVHRAIGQLRAMTLFDTGGLRDRSAEEAFLQSIDIFRELGNEREAARSLVELAKHLVERGELETAKERFREARATFRRMGLQDEASQLDQTLTELS